MRAELQRISMHVRPQSVTKRFGTRAFLSPPVSRSPSRALAVTRTTHQSTIDRKLQNLMTTGRWGGQTGHEDFGKNVFNAQAGGVLVLIRIFGDFRVFFWPVLAK